MVYTGKIPAGKKVTNKFGSYEARFELPRLREKGTWSVSVYDLAGQYVSGASVRGYLRQGEAIQDAKARMKAIKEASK